VQRGNFKYDNPIFLNTILYVTENGCKWRSLSKEYGNWNSIYMRANRWSKAGVLDKPWDYNRALQEAERSRAILSQM
jgi:transposase